MNAKLTLTLVAIALVGCASGPQPQRQTDERTQRREPFSACKTVNRCQVLKGKELERAQDDARSAAPAPSDASHR